MRLPQPGACPRRAILATALLLSLATTAHAVEVTLRTGGGVHHVQARINRVAAVEFVLDSGASEVCIPENVVYALVRAGTMSQADVLRPKIARLADGSQTVVRRVMLREVEVGGVVVKELPAIIVAGEAPMLLGQSFLSRLSAWSIDNERAVLKLTARRESDPPARIPTQVIAEIRTPAEGEHVARAFFVTGRVTGLQVGQTAFLVIQSTVTRYGRRLYPQRALAVEPDGRWTVRAIYGSDGYEYLTYVVVAETDEAREALSQESARQKGISELPSGAKRVGAVITVTARH